VRPGRKSRGEGKNTVNRQKLLWVILSVTLLVILILVGGLWLFRDKATVPVAEAAREPRVNYDLFEIPLHNTPLPGIQELEPAKPADEQNAIEKQDFILGDNAPEESNVLPQKTVTREPRARIAPTPRPVTTKRTSMTTAKTTGPAKTSGNLYWIQTGSYKSKSKADSCNAVLIENGLSGRILTKQINDDTFFRVRIGPYANKNEAAKFLSWIRKIDGLEESYISLEYSAKN
jgi:cell division protein FtsN